MSSAKKTLSVDLAAWLLAGTQLVSTPAATIVLSASLSALVLAGPAQAQVDDDEDDDDEDEDPIDDGDILDDAPADDPGGDDPGALPRDDAKVSTL